MARGSVRSPPPKPWQIYLPRSRGYFNPSTRELAQLQLMLNSKLGSPVFLSYWKLLVSGSLRGIESRTIHQLDRIETRSRVERQDLSCSLGVAIVFLPASDQMALWTLKEQEWVSLGMIPASPFPLPRPVTGSLPSWLSLCTKPAGLGLPLWLFHKQQFSESGGESALWD